MEVAGENKGAKRRSSGQYAIIETGNGPGTLAKTCREKVGNHAVVRASISNLSQGTSFPETQACLPT